MADKLTYQCNTVYKWLTNVITSLSYRWHHMVILSPHIAGYILTFYVGAAKLEKHEQITDQLRYLSHNSNS